MGFISEQIKKSYKDVLFRRHDSDNSIFYFDYDDFLGLKKYEYPFENRKGEMLHGAFYCYDEPIKAKLVVFDHGLANGHKAYMREIEMLCRHGYLVFAFDHTGSDRSEGEHVNGLLGSLADIDDCLNILKNVSEIADREIYLIGHSRGGFSSLNVFPTHPEVKKVVAMSGFTSLKNMHNQLIPWIASPLKKIVYELEKQHNPEYADVSAFEALSKTTTPVLMIHSLDDNTVSAKFSILELRKQLFDRENLEFVLLNGKGHNPNYTTYAVAYKDKFFKERTRLLKKGLLESEEQKSLFVNMYDWMAMTEQDEEVWEKIFKFYDK